MLSVNRFQAGTADGTFNEPIRRSTRDKFISAQYSRNLSASNLFAEGFSYNSCHVKTHVIIPIKVFYVIVKDKNFDKHFNGLAYYTY